MAQNTALRELIAKLKSERLSNPIDSPLNIGLTVAISLAINLLPKERQDIQEAFDKGKGNVFGKTCFLIKDGTEYFDKTFTQNK